LTTAAGCPIEPIWATLLAKALDGKNVKDMLTNVGSGSGGAAVAAAPAAGGAAAGGALAEEKKEEKKEEEKEESDGEWLLVMDGASKQRSILLTCALSFIRR
jgi:large subunit ribosomal protein LP1